jgi:hypothetical protein
MVVWLTGEAGAQRRSTNERPTRVVAAAELPQAFAAAAGSPKEVSVPVTEGLAGFAGVPGTSLGTGEFTTDGGPASFPTGFDAAVQCDGRLLQVSLVRGLEAVGASTLSVKVPYPATALPSEVAQAVARLVRPVDLIGADEEIYVELRLVGPWLAGLSAGYEPPAGSIVVPSGIALARPALPAGPPYQIGWTLELNLLRIERTRVFTMGAGAPVPARPVVAGVVPASTATTGGVPATSSGIETRTLLASGSATLAAPARIGTDASLLLTWLELDAAQAAVDVTTDAPLLQGLLAAQLGKDMVQTALRTLTTQGSVRVSPLFALGGALSREQVAEMGLQAMAVVHAVGRTADGRWLLTLGVTFGAGSHASSAQLQPFLGSGNFASYADLSFLSRVLSERWRTNSAGRHYVGNVPVVMPINAGSTETGQGTARVQVDLADALSEVTLAPLEGIYGDVVQLACDESVQILKLWYADGSEVSDLGDLGQPATMPLVVNNAPFTPPDPNESRTAPFRVFVRSVLEPLVFPFLDDYEVDAVDGFASGALGAVVTHWSLHVPRPQDVVAGTVGAAMGGAP